MSLAVLLLIVAVVLLLLAALGWSPPKVNLTALGLALWALSTLVHALWQGSP